MSPNSTEESSQNNLRSNRSQTDSEIGSQFLSISVLDLRKLFGIEIPAAIRISVMISHEISNREFCI